MRKWGLVVACCALVMSTGCVYYSAPVMPPPGLLFSSVQAPIDTDVQSNAIGPRSGESSTIGVLGLLAFGDASIATAVQNGNLTRVDHVDYEFLNVLFVFQQFTIRAYGE